MKNIIDGYFLKFIIGGSILSGATYLANHTNPLLGSILVTVPLELVSLFFIDDKYLLSYTKDILIMSFATFIPVLFYYLVYLKYQSSSRIHMILAFLVWLMLSLGIYYWRNRF